MKKLLLLFFIFSANFLFAQRNDSLYWQKKGNIAFDSTMYAKSIVHYTTAISQNPKNVINYENRGTAKYCLGQFQNAMDDFSKALELAPNDTAAYIGRGKVEFAMRKYDEAFAD